MKHLKYIVDNHEYVKYVMSVGDSDHVGMAGSGASLSRELATLAHLEKLSSCNPLQ